MLAWRGLRLLGILAVSLMVSNVANSPGGITDEADPVEAPASEGEEGKAANGYEVETVLPAFT